MQCKIFSSSQTQMTVVVSVRPWTTGCSKYSNAYLQAGLFSVSVDFIFVGGKRHYSATLILTVPMRSPLKNMYPLPLIPTTFETSYFFEERGCVGEGLSSLSLSENLVPLLRLSVLSPSKLSPWFPQVSMVSLMSNQRQRDSTKSRRQTSNNSPSALSPGLKLLYGAIPVYSWVPTSPFSSPWVGGKYSISGRSW